jgi:hypothetical protein
MKCPKCSYVALDIDCRRARGDYASVCHYCPNCGYKEEYINELKCDRDNFRYGDSYIDDFISKNVICPRCYSRKSERIGVLGSSEITDTDVDVFIIVRECYYCENTIWEILSRPTAMQIKERENNTFEEITLEQVAKNPSVLEKVKLKKNWTKLDRANYYLYNLLPEKS